MLSPTPSGSGGAGVGRGIIRTLGRLDAVQTEAIVHHAGHVRNRVAAAEQVGQVKDAAVGVNGRIGVLTPCDRRRA